MVTVFGMSDKLGPRTLVKGRADLPGSRDSEQRDYSEKTALQIDVEVNKFIDQSHELAQKILAENKSKLIQLAQTLIVKETLEGEELEAVFNAPATAPLPIIAPASGSTVPASEPVPITDPCSCAPTHFQASLTATAAVRRSELSELTWIQVSSLSLALTR